MSRVGVQRICVCAQLAIYTGTISIICPGGRLCGCGFPTELGAKVKTSIISSGASGGVFTIVSTREDFPLYGIIMHHCSLLYCLIKKHRILCNFPKFSITRYLCYESIRFDDLHACISVFTSCTLLLTVIGCYSNSKYCERFGSPTWCVIS